MLAHGQACARRVRKLYSDDADTPNGRQPQRSGVKQSDGGSGKKVICTEERSRRDNALRIALTLDLLKINSIRKKKIIRNCRVENATLAYTRKSRDMELEFPLLKDTYS